MAQQIAEEFVGTSADLLTRVSGVAGTRRRVGVNGKPRYAAIYHDARGVRRSAGTYATRREAERAWAAAEADALLGHGRDPHRGKISFGLDGLGGSNDPHYVRRNVWREHSHA